MFPDYVFQSLISRKKLQNWSKHRGICSHKMSCHIRGFSKIEVAIFEAFLALILWNFAGDLRWLVKIEDLPQSKLPTECQYFILLWIKPWKICIYYLSIMSYEKHKKMLKYALIYAFIFYLIFMDLIVLGVKDHFWLTIK